jgi:phosphoglycolate phosphatase-like HAD superfamily hydrolase
VALNNYEFGKPYREIANEYKIIHDELALQKQMPYEDAQLLLESVKRAGKRNFIYTHSGKIIYKLMDKWGLSEYISDSMDSTYNFPRKPDPEALNFLIEKNNIIRNTALMVGDRDIDIDVAHNAGIAACLYDYENYYPQVKAEHKVITLSEIISFM